MIIKRSLLISNGVNNYGYDVFGNEIDSSDYDDPLTSSYQRW
jgi:hypothetical protein